MCSTPLTKKQQQVLNFIERFLRKHNYFPSVRDGCEGLGLSSTSTVQGHYDALVRKGKLVRGGSKHSRTLTLASDPEQVQVQDSPQEQHRLPLLGLAGCHAGVEGAQVTREQAEYHLLVPETISRSRNDFLVEASGDSMIGVGIFDGDIVVITPQQTARDGDLVLCRYGEDEGANDVAIKRYFGGRCGARLISENPEHGPIEAPFVEVVGKVVGQFRRF